MCSMVAQRLTLITRPAATPDQLWQRVEAAWSTVPQEHIQSLFESMPRRGAACLRPQCPKKKRSSQAVLRLNSASEKKSVLLKEDQTDL
ncbi:hypothetical protein TNCV_1106171 [Trichonephila clavipes]|nr:hypothetical protein TNCV_1106171 [Trichonephila clavipes]